MVDCKTRSCFGGFSRTPLPRANRTALLDCISVGLVQWKEQFVSAGLLYSL